MDMRAEIAIIGMGYFGLMTGAWLAHLGHVVACVDLEAAKVERLKRGEIPIVEAGLSELVRKGINSNRLSFTTAATEVAASVDFVFLCVPTPQDEGGSADLSYVRQAAATIGPHLGAGAIVINKSTVSVGSVGTTSRSCRIRSYSAKGPLSPTFLNRTGPGRGRQ